MNYLVSQIVNFITEQDVISDESDVQDFYRYGIEISISSLLNIRKFSIMITRYDKLMYILCVSSALSESTWRSDTRIKEDINTVIIGDQSDIV